jgi:hypothetical protein
VHAQLARWEAQWAWDYGVQGKPYDDAAQEYLTRQGMRLSAEAWDALDAQERVQAVARKLWVPENQKARAPLLASAAACMGGVLSAAMIEASSAAQALLRGMHIQLGHMRCSCEGHACDAAAGWLHEGRNGWVTATRAE